MNGRNMGKESRLRNQRSVSKYEYSNGDRKLYDRDAMPEGLDSDIWSLALYFEHHAEVNGFSTPGRPIIYTELYYRIAADSDLCELLRKDPSLTTYVRDTNGICDIDPTMIGYSNYDGLIVGIVSMMITDYWNHDNNYDYNHSINDFCAITVFTYLKDYIVSSIKRKLLINTGIRVSAEEGEIKPSRRTEQDKELFDIINKPLTEEEIRDRFASWKRNTAQPS
jgi:hypothetical protein